MRIAGWLSAGLVLGFPPLSSAQTVKKADLVGGWEAELEPPPGREGEAGWRAWLVLWPDGLWWYGGPLTADRHGGARWRLVGDTLWLGNDYIPYFHPIVGPRLQVYTRKKIPYGVMDTAIINGRSAFPVPDSVYWSKTFRDTTTACAEGIPGQGGCGTWVYKVSKQGQHFVLNRLDHLSQGVRKVANRAVLKRDSLVGCIGKAISGC